MNIRKKVIFLALLLVSLIAFNWFATHAYIEISVNNPADGAITHQLYEQSSQKEIEVEDTDKSVKRLVRRGDYEVLVKQGLNSYFAVAKAGRFLGTTKLDARLSPEREREFIGNNPGPCAGRVSGVLLSYGCGDEFQNIQIHVPATGAEPTFVRKTTSSILGTIEGIVTTSEGGVAIIRADELSEGESAPHSAYRIDGSANLSDGKALEGLDAEKYHTAISYKTGFLIYDDKFEKVSYYASRASKPQEISIQRPADDSVKPYALTVSGDDILLAYSNNSEGEVADIDEADNGKVKTVFVVRGTGNDRKQIELKGQYMAAHLCGSRKLCALKGSLLEIYDMTGAKPKLMRKVTNVDAIHDSNKELLIVKAGQLLKFDVDNFVGSVEYTPGDYTYCGFYKDIAGYMLCLVDSKQKKVMLSIKEGALTKSAVDRQISELLKLPEVDNISTYGQHIFISPNLGEPAYDNASKSFTYSPATISLVNNSINQAIERVGIDRSKYSIVNTFK